MHSLCARVGNCRRGLRGVAATFKFMPDIGAMIFHIFPEAKRQGLDPIVHTKILYKLPVPTATKFKAGRTLAAKD